MVVAIALARIRIGRGGLGWWTLVWVSFIGLLLFVSPNRANSLARSPHHWGCCPGPSPLKRVREPNLPSSEIGEAGALCAEAHSTPSGLSIEHDVQGCQLMVEKG